MSIQVFAEKDVFTSHFTSTCKSTKVLIHRGHLKKSCGIWTQRFLSLQEINENYCFLEESQINVKSLNYPEDKHRIDTPSCLLLDVTC